MKLWRDRYEHHLIHKVADEGIDEMKRVLRSNLPSRTGDSFECTQEEGRKVFLHRFVAAGAAVRYRTVNAASTGELVSLDIALRRNERMWFECLPGDIRFGIQHAHYYGHFFCFVFHHDYILRPGVDAHDIEMTLRLLLDERGAECPAEHNVSHHYHAKESLRGFYRDLICAAASPDPIRLDVGVPETGSHGFAIQRVQAFDR